MCNQSGKHKFDFESFERVVKASWFVGRGYTKPEGEYEFFYGQGDENHELGTAFFIHKRISAVKRV
jgi:hypothetical protein